MESYLQIPTVCLSVRLSEHYNIGEDLLRTFYPLFTHFISSATKKSSSIFYFNIHNVSLGEKCEIKFYTSDIQFVFTNFVKVCPRGSVLIQERGLSATLYLRLRHAIHKQLLKTRCKNNRSICNLFLTQE